MKKIITLFLLAVVFSVNAQDSTFGLKPFFSTNITFTENEFSSFYSAFTIDNNQVIFNANNYKLFCFNKETGALNWEFNTHRKTNKPPYVYGGSIIVGNYTNERHNYVQLDLNSGILIQTLYIETLNTQPFFKDSIMYCTAIAEYGQLIAYDLKANSILWAKFIAHGVGTQPYYLENKIIANAEDDNWFEINYKGQLLDTTCIKKAELFVEDIKCVRNFKFLTHDGKEITEAFIENQFENNSNVKVKTANEKTFLLGDYKLLIIGNKKKIKKSVEIEKIITLPETDDNEYMEILKIEDNTIWFFYKNSLVVYDFKKNKTLHEYNLSKWNAHQIMLNDNNIWLVSKNDGQLYGLKMK